MAKNSTKKKTTTREQYTAPALEKGLDILELLAREPAGLTLSDIALKLERSVGEIFRMLAVLDRRGFLTLESTTDRYALTLKMFELSHLFPPIKRLTSAALPLMQKLATDLEQSCHMVVYHDGRGLVVAQVDSPAARGFSVRLGAEVPLVDSCSGHLILAYCEPEARAEILKRQPEHLQKRISKSNLDAMVKRIHEQQYESIASTQIQGIQDIGYPLFDYSNNMIATLAIPHIEHLDMSHRVSIEEAKSALAKAADIISTSLGYH
jgi:DNA-binding IclR family transcriptional regulator